MFDVLLVYDSGDDDDDDAAIANFTLPRPAIHILLFMTMILTIIVVEVEKPDNADDFGCVQSSSGSRCLLWSQIQ